MQNKHLLAALSVALLTAAATVRADDAQSAPWQFGVTIPLWAAGIDGNTTIQGVQRDLNISFDQLKDHLDASYALALEARKGRFGVFASAGYMKFSADGKSAAGGRADISSKFLLVDGGVSYLLIRTESAHPFLLEGTLGVRYWYTETSLLLKDAGGNVLVNGSNTQDLVDPMVGLRGSQYLTPKWHLDFAGDIGGFGLSDNQAELDWSATGMVTYDFAKWFSLSGGYKAVGLNASAGSGTGKNGVDIIMNGALLAAKFTF